MKSIKILIICILVSFISSAEEAPKLTESSEISLLTCSPGEELYSLFGHSALRISDPALGLDVVFNYGTFTFDEDFYFNFTMGRLNYMLSASSIDGFIRTYQYAERGVVEQILDLNLKQKQSIVDFMAWNAQPEERYYLYDFFFDNCSSRLRDVLDSALHEDEMQFPVMTLQTHPTFRNVIDTYLVYHPWGDFGIDLGLGMPCDAIIANDEYDFLPDELFRSFAGATLNGSPLIKETRVLLEPTPLTSNWSWFNPIPLMWLIAGLILISSAYGFRKQRIYIAIDVIYMIIVGAAGLLIFFLWFITDHTAVGPNLNILWAWPVHILALLFYKNKVFRSTYWLVYGGVLLLTVLTFAILPQTLHLATIPIMVAGIARAALNYSINR